MKTFAKPITLSLLFASGFYGCAVQSATRWSTTIPKARVTECNELCESVDMKLGALVVILNRVGCVCDVTSPSGAKRSSAAAAGGAVIQMIADQQRQAAKQK